MVCSCRKQLRSPSGCMEIVQGFKDLGGGLWLEWSVSWGRSRGEAARKPLPKLAKVSSGTGAVGATRKVETAHLSGSQPSVDLLLSRSLYRPRSTSSLSFLPFVLSFLSHSFGQQHSFIRIFLHSDLDGHLLYCTPSFHTSLVLGHPFPQTHTHTPNTNSQTTTVTCKHSLQDNLRLNT